ncbi:two-partner secretion domain-containing protein, partial [Spiribacter pallidus]
MSETPVTALHRAARVAMVSGSVAALGLAGQWAKAAPAAGELPQGERITAGDATIGRDGRVMTITQRSDRLITEWQGFSIGREAHVEFIQPGRESAALNRVTSGRPSEIFGSLSANGQVLLVNQAGIHFASGSRVDAGSLVASTLAIADEDFLADRLRFAGGSQAGIVAEGEINVAEGGHLALVAPTIEQRGHIEAPSGGVALAAAEAVELTLGDTGLVSMKVERGALDAAIDNGGVIEVGDGAVVMTAEGMDELTRGVVNNTGTIEASGLSAEGGRIVLEADGAVNNTGRLAAGSEQGAGGEIRIDAGTVSEINGTLDVSSTAAGGGLVTVEADHIRLGGATMVDATGATGGGDVLIGGDWQGGDHAEYRVFNDPEALREAVSVDM